MTDAEDPRPIWGTPHPPPPGRGGPRGAPPPAQVRGNGPMSPIPQWNPPPWVNQAQGNQPQWNQARWNPVQWNQAQGNQLQWNPNRPAPRDLAVAYALLVLLGTFGLHKFYLRSNGPGGFYLALGLIGWGTCWLSSGLLLLVLLWFMLLVDFATLPGQVRRANARIWQGIPGAW
jgi:TM2 domain-containing membrane protein YozV